MKINDNYVAGMLELNGGFFLHRRKYLWYLVRVNDTEQGKIDLWTKVFNHLLTQHDIHYSKNHCKGKWEFRVGDKESTIKFLKFIGKYTIYKKKKIPKDHYLYQESRRR